MSQHASCTATSQPTPTLPEINECIQNLDLAIPIPLKETCAICATTFAEDENPSEEEDADDIVQTSCTHPYHRTCLLNWFTSTNPKRNTCPTCRTTQFRLNLLTPEQTASRQAEDDISFAETIDLDLPRFTLLMAETDAQFAARIPGDYAYSRFLRIVDSVNDWNHDYNGGNEHPLCPEHAEAGDEWVMHAVGTRLLDLIQDAGIPFDGAAVQHLRIFMQDWALYLSLFQEDEDSEADDDSESRSEFSETDSASGPSPSASSGPLLPVAVCEARDRLAELFFVVGAVELVGTVRRYPNPTCCGTSPAWNFDMSDPAGFVTVRADDCVVVAGWAIFFNKNEWE